MNEVSRDEINPNHYRQGGIEVIDVIEAYALGFNLGNVVKYTLRAGKKDDALADLKKARWYLDREIDLLNAERGNRMDQMPPVPIKKGETYKKKD